MKVTIELDLDRPDERTLAEDLVARRAAPAAPPTRKPQRRRGTTLPPLTDQEAARVTPRDRAAAVRVAEEKGWVRQ